MHRINFERKTSKTNERINDKKVIGNYKNWKLEIWGERTVGTEIKPDDWRTQNLLTV